MKTTRIWIVAPAGTPFGQLHWSSTSFVPGPATQVPLVPVFTRVSSLKVPVLIPVRNSFEMLLGPVFLAQMSKAALNRGRLGWTAAGGQRCANARPIANLQRRRRGRHEGRAGHRSDHEGRRQTDCCEGTRGSIADHGSICLVSVLTRRTLPGNRGSRGLGAAQCMRWVMFVLVRSDSRYPHQSALNALEGSLCNGSGHDPLTVVTPGTSTV